MPIKTCHTLIVAVVVALAGAASARQDPPLDIALLTQQFGDCLTALERGDIKDGTVNESAQMRTCRKFLEATWDYRPDRTGWSNQINHQALTADLKGVGVCFRTARRLEDADKMARVIAHFSAVWEELAGDYVAGRVQPFVIRAGGFAKEVNLSAMEATKWETQPDASFWNANCAGFFGTERDDIADGPNGEATFALNGAQNILTISGLIEPGFAERLIEKLKDHQFVSSLALSSVGGTDVEEAMKVGRVIRDRGIHTKAIGNCESACTMLFAAGQMRFVGGAYSDTLSFGRVGFHRMSVYGMPIPDDSELYEKVAAYFLSMGVRPDMVLDFMTREDGLAFYYPSLDELCAADILGVALPPSPFGALMNGGQSNCVRHRFLERYDNFFRAPDQ